MSEGILFVGGSADGMRKVYDNPREHIYIQVMRGSFMWVSDSNSAIITETYNRVGPNCYLISTEHPDNLVRLLMEGYRQVKAKEI